MPIRKTYLSISYGAARRPSTSSGWTGAATKKRASPSTFYRTTSDSLLFCCQTLYLATIILLRRSQTKLRSNEDWRRHPDSNRGSRFCRPVPYHLAMPPRIIQLFTYKKVNILNVAENSYSASFLPPILSTDELTIKNPCHLFLQKDNKGNYYHHLQ